jgi:hypothetical protein
MLGNTARLSIQKGSIMSRIIDRYRDRPRRRCKLRPVALEALEERSMLSVGMPLLARVKVLEAAAPVPITLHLGGSCAPAGDFVDVATSRVVLTGRAAPGATVWLDRGLASGKQREIGKTRADARGNYRLRMNCRMGITALTVRVVNPRELRAAPACP